MGIKPWPTLTLLMEGGPDDGRVVHLPAGKGPEPPRGAAVLGRPDGRAVRAAPGAGRAFGVAL